MPRDLESFLRCDAAPVPFVIQGASEGFELLAADASGDGVPAKPRRFQMTAYTGGTMRPPGFGGLPVVVDLAGVTVPRQDLPALRQHDPGRIVGHTTAIEVSAQRIKASGVVSGTGEAATEVLATASNGYPWQTSIGAAVERAEYVDRGQAVKVNGRSFTGPLYVVRAASLQEISFVTLGADGATSATVAAQHQRYSMTFAQWLAARGVSDAATLTDGVRAALQAQYDAEQKPKPPAPTPATEPSTLVAERQQRAAEIEREEGIRRVCAAAGNPTIEVGPAGQRRAVALAAHAVAEGWDVDRAEQRAQLEQLRAGRSGPAIVVRAAQEATPDVLSAAIAQAGRLPNVERAFTPQTLEAAHRAYRGRIGLQQLILEAAYANGYTGPAAVKPNLREVLRAAFSTNAIPGILSNTANKFLLAGFMSVEGVWRIVAKVSSVGDFKTVTRYRMTGGFQFEKVGPTGEIEHGTTGEESFTNKADTYATMFALTRQDWINDDLGAMTDLPTRIGRGGHLKLNDVFWPEFMANSDFFKAGNSNYLSGAGSALGAAALAAAEQKFLDLKDPDGKPLALSPAVLLVPTALKRTAMELMASGSFVPGGASPADRVATANTWQGAYTVAVSAYLGNASYAGNSQKAHYLLASPSDLPVIEVVFLDGIETPTVESADADFNTLGVQMRGFWDFGVKKQDYRGGVKSKGEA